jgi:hypothetical protein
MRCHWLEVSLLSQMGAGHLALEPSTFQEAGDSINHHRTDADTHVDLVVNKRYTCGLRAWSAAETVEIIRAPFNDDSIKQVLVIQKHTSCSTFPNMQLSPLQDQYGWAKFGISTSRKVFGLLPHHHTRRLLAVHKCECFPANRRGANPVSTNRKYSPLAAEFENDKLCHGS